MRPVVTFVAAMALASCAAYENAPVGGHYVDVPRADIATALHIIRADPKLARPNDTLREIWVQSPDEIHLIWDSKELDIIERAHGRWHYVLTKITLG